MAASNHGRARLRDLREAPGGGAPAGAGDPRRRPRRRHPPGDGPLGQAFIETRRHVAGVDGLTDAEAATVGRLTTRLARALRRELGSASVHAFVAGVHVDHFHQHVLAVAPEAPADQPWWSPWTGGPHGDVYELAEAVAPELV